MTSYIFFAVVFTVLLCTKFASAAPRKDKPYVIRSFSDSHIGSPDFGHVQQQQTFLNFMADLQKPDCYVDHVIMNGDIFDCWTIPYNEEPYDLTGIAEKTDLFKTNVSQFIDAVRQAGKRLKVTYISGNHDVIVNATQVKKVFGSNVDYAREINTRHTTFMHGCQYDMMNSLPPSDPQEFPFGYTITRSAAEGGYSDMNSTKGYYYELCKELGSQVATDVVKLIINPETWEIFEGLIYTTALGHNWADYADIPLLGGHWVMYSNEDITLRKTMDHYSTLVKEYVDAYGLDAAGNDLVGTCGSFKYQLAQVPETIDAMILGHTHDPLLEVHSRGAGNRDIVYANSGTWIKFRMNFVDVEYDYDGQHPTWIRLYDYLDDHEQEAESLWMYAPDGDQLVSSIGRVGNSFKFQTGPLLDCPGECTMEYTYDMVNMYTLAILNFAGVLDMHDDKQEGSVGPWYGRYWKALNGKLELGPVVTKPISPPSFAAGDVPTEAYMAFNYSASANAMPIYSLVEWWTDEGYQQLIS